MKYEAVHGSKIIEVPEAWRQPGFGHLSLLLTGGCAVQGEGVERGLPPCSGLYLPAVLTESVRTEAAHAVLVLCDEEQIPSPREGVLLELDELTAGLLDSLFFQGPLPLDHIESGLRCLRYRLAEKSPEGGGGRRAVGPGEAIRTYLVEHMEEALTLDRLAEAFGCSPVGMIRRSQKHLGESPMRLLAQIRLARAKQLLEQTERTVSQIAYAVGYSDPAAFSHFFKRKTGRSPREFRTNCRWLV